MKNTMCCPKCHSGNIVRVPDNPARHASGNNIYTATMSPSRKNGHKKALKNGMKHSRSGFCGN